MVAHNARSRHSSSLYLFLVLGLSLMMIAVVWARLLGLNNPTTSKSEFQTYNNAKYHFSVSYPQDWQMQTASSDSNIVTLSSFVMQTAGDGGDVVKANLPLNMSKIDIMSYDVDAGTSAQDLLNMQTGAVSVMQGNLSNLKLDGQDALKINVPTASSLLHGNESNPTYTSIYVTNGTHGFIIAGYAEPVVFDQIINSFHTN